METNAPVESTIRQIALGIAGIGLIGGSIAAAARARGISSRIIGIGRSAERLDAARQAGLIDDFSTEYEVCRDIDLFVSCLPVDRIVESVRQAAHHLPDGSIATDAGSTKAAICEALGEHPAPGVTFIGSHPLAGSEKTGFEHARADLFEGRVCVITPSAGESPESVSDLAAFWRSLGSRVVSISAAEHDTILARTSHVPHLAAAAVAGGVDESDLLFTAGGFRDATRIASGDPLLWAGILLANQEAVGAELDALIARCGRFREALRRGDRAVLRTLLTDAKARRDALDDS